MFELLNINNPILNLLSKKAPGTMKHVLMVSIIAEEAANFIGANSSLTKIGGIYHDIGKIKNSNFFIENQSHIKENPHKKLNPKKSAKIILKHVSNGVKIAKKYNIPNYIIDFIQTHHGNGLIYSFYKKEKIKNPNIKVNKKYFQYKGPKPFSKETTIVMIADSLEAASKSIKNPSNYDLENVVEKVISEKEKEDQFSNTNLTSKEMNKIKKFFKKKLKFIYKYKK